MWKIPVVCIFAVVTAALASAQEREIGPDVRTHNALQSKFLRTPRDVMVWTPPAYTTERDKRYPVLYLQDGSNAYIVWRIDEIAKRLIAAGEIEPLIIVMIPNTGFPQERYEDYTPTLPRNVKFGGKADEYGRFLVEEVKPLIDREYRTLPDAANTGIGGASLGALVSLYLGLKYPDLFTRLALISPAVWWDDKIIVRKVNTLKAKPASRVWID